MTQIARGALGFGIHVVPRSARGRSSGPAPRPDGHPPGVAARRPDRIRDRTVRPRSPEPVQPGRGMSRTSIISCPPCPASTAAHRGRAAGSRPRAGRSGGRGLGRRRRAPGADAARRADGRRAPTARLVRVAGAVRHRRESAGPRCCLDFTADPHFLVLGDTETGKSNLLHLIADAGVEDAVLAGPGAARQRGLPAVAARRGRHRPSTGSAMPSPRLATTRDAPQRCPRGAGHPAASHRPKRGRPTAQPVLVARL